MLLELCVTELEDVAADKQAVCGVVQPVVQESPHPYTDDMTLAGTARVPGMSLSSLPYSPAMTSLTAAVMWSLIAFLYRLLYSQAVLLDCVRAVKCSDVMPTT